MRSNRRVFIKKSLQASILVGAGIPMLSSCADGAGGDENEDSVEQVPLSFAQAALPYAFDALEPHIDTMTMEIHYGKHHAGYVSNLNNALAENNITAANVEELLANVSTHPTAIRNNAGGHYNHDLFWNIMKPGGNEVPGKLSEAINASFGSMDSFKEEFSKAATGRFGSGWAWLVESNGKLMIGSTPNQDNPLMDVSELKGTPLLGLDVWEHAYYLNYQNLRGDYVKNWWNLVNYNEVAARMS